MIWKHELVITTKKKTFELITDSKHFMEKLLFAFGNLISTKTNKPLFNWNSYVGLQENQSSPSNFPLPKSADASPQKEKEASFTSPEKSPADITTLQPEQRGEMSAELMKIERVSKEEVAQQSPSGDSCSSDDQKENKESQEGVQKKYAPISMRRKGNSFAATRGKGFAVEEKNGEREASSPVKREQREQGLERMEVKKSLSPVKESLSPLKKGKIQISVQMLNLDKIESEIKEEERPVVGSHREMMKKGNLGEISVRRTANRLVVNNKSASMKNMVEKPDFVGFNEIELGNNKIKSSKCGVQVLGSARRGDSYERQMSFGTGVVQEASKFSLFKQSEKTVKAVEVKKSEKNDDDWDNEMFGEGKHQLSPLKPKNYEEKQHMFSDKKIQSQLSQKRSEFVASRQGTHNDWDDEL